MVQQNLEQAKVQLPSPPEKSFLPRRAQPWETASLVVGIPGTIAAAAATCALVMYATHGDVMVAGIVAATLWTVWLGGLSVIWLGVASEGPDR